MYNVVDFETAAQGTMAQVSPTSSLCDVLTNRKLAFVSAAKLNGGGIQPTYSCIVSCPAVVMHRRIASSGSSCPPNLHSTTLSTVRRLLFGVRGSTQHEHSMGHQEHTPSMPTLAVEARPWRAHALFRGEDGAGSHLFGDSASATLIAGRGLPNPTASARC